MVSDSNDKARQLRELEVGKGIQYVLNQSYKILKSPALVHDMEFKLIAYAENVVTEDPIWNEYVNKGRVGIEWLEFFKEENFLDAVANTDTITCLYTDKLKLNRYAGKLYNRDGVQVGATCAIEEENAPFDDDYPMLFKLFCDILNREIAISEYYRDYGQEYQEIMINMLIDNVITDKELYTANVESIYANLKGYLFVIIVNIPESEKTYDQLLFFKNLFKQKVPDYKYSIYKEYIVAIISSEKPIFHDFTINLDKFRPIFKQYKITSGVSSSFENLFELNKYYNQALYALEYGYELGKGLRIFVND